MTFRRNWPLCGLLYLLALLLPVILPPVWAQSEPSSAESGRADGGNETLLPGATNAFFSVSNFPDLIDHFTQTQLGKLAADPVMRPFVEQVQARINGELAGLPGKLGLTLDDLRGVAGGEVSVALIGAKPDAKFDTTALMLLVDVTGAHQKAQALLEKVAEDLVEARAKQTSADAAGVPIEVFELPGDDPSAPKRQVVYFLTETYLGASDSQDAVADVLGRILDDDAPSSPSLAKLEAFRAVMDRCSLDAPDHAPQIRWFVEPFGYARAVRSAIPPSKRRKGRPIYEILEAVGFDAFQGVGGYVDVGVEGFEVLHRTAIHAPQPREKSMRMLVFPNTSEFTPQDWVPRDVATFAMGNVDPLALFDNFGPLFDEFLEEEGAWADVLEGLELDPNGPRVNIRDELISHLTGRVTIVADNELPITPDSQRVVIALSVSDERAVEKALRKMFDPDPNMKLRVIPGYEYEIWEFLPPPEDPDHQGPPPVEIPSLPGVGSIGPDPAPARSLIDDERQPLVELPNAAVTVAEGELFLVSHLDYLQKILDREEDSRNTLANSVDFRLIEAVIQSFGGQQDSGRSFSRTDEEFRLTYELIRQGKMPESQTVLGQVLNALLAGTDEDTLRQQQIDGKQLPEFEVIRRHFGLSGLLGRTEESGWFAKGFILGKE